jgi:cytochrome c553
LFESKVALFAAATLTLAAVLGPTASRAQAPAPPLSPITLEGNAERGAALAETCYGCHGIPNSHNAYPPYLVPRLGGQNADYIEVALQGYRRGTRNHETMQAQASTLSDQDIADVAAYFSGLPGEPSVGKTGHDALKVEEGMRKATACIACHGQEGVAAAPQWPNLAGQHESYLLEALGQYKSGKRVDMLMGPLIAPLDEETIEQLAAFFSAQPHLHDTAR